MNKKLEPYVTLVDFLADYLGENTEVVLHDTTDWHNSIVAIRNGHVSGRKIGAPITGLALDMVKSRVYEEQSYKVNYKGLSAHGYTIRSATYFIKDDYKETVKRGAIKYVNMSEDDFTYIYLLPIQISSSPFYLLR